MIILLYYIIFQPDNLSVDELFRKKLRTMIIPAQKILNFNINNFDKLKMIKSLRY